ncbi:MAG: NADH-quinone oxidoreductase subunit A [Coriobacteriia bacterium]|nr:NADH-quinone oxidoreductase subunit A [Coriobacteriia bacterium]
MGSFDHMVVGAFLAFGVVFVVATVWVSNLLSPKGKDAPDRLEPYECGSEPVGPSWVQFRVGYYVYALLFVVFDIETVFLYPWAVVFDQMPLFILVEMFIFIAILAAGLGYAWKEGALRWR